MAKEGRPSPRTSTTLTSPSIPCMNRSTPRMTPSPILSTPRFLSHFSPPSCRSMPASEIATIIQCSRERIENEQRSVVRMLSTRVHPRSTAVAVRIRTGVSKFSYDSSSSIGSDTRGGADEDNSSAYDPGYAKVKLAPDPSSTSSKAITTTKTSETTITATRPAASHLDHLYSKVDFFIPRQFLD